MAQATPGHISITVSGAKTKLIVDPNTYGMVDITDFAPRAVSGTPSFSTLGLYLDVAQESFGHGFGQVEFAEPQSYHYTGHQVDTRHKFASLWTNHTQEALVVTNLLNKTIIRNSIPLLGFGVLGLYARRPSGAGYIELIASTSIFDILDVGKYIILANLNRLMVADVATATAGGASTITFSGASWATNVWAGATLLVFDGTALGNTRTVASNTATEITVTVPFSATPTTTSCFVVYKVTGSAVNQPTDFYKLTVFGGNYWAYERSTNRLHFWAEDDGSDAEGGASDAGAVVVGSVTRGLGIVNMIPFQNQLWIFRWDGAWVINEQDTDALAYHTLDFSSETNVENFASVIVWQGFLVFAIRNRLYKYRSGLQDITPPVWDEYPPFKQFGGIRGLTARGKYLYMLAFSNEANSDETLETTTGFGSLLCHDGVGWHKLMDLPAGTPPYLSGANMWYMPTTDKLYLYARTAANSWLWNIQLQTYSDVPYASYPTTGTHNLYTSYFDLGMRRIPKSFSSFIIRGNFPSGTSVVVAYRTDDTLSWTSLGTIDADMEELSFATSTTGKRIQFRLSLATSNASNTPVIKAIIMKCMIRPRVQYGMNCDIIVADSLSDHNRNAVGHTAKETRAALLAARDSIAPLTVVDLYGDSRTGYLSSLRFGVVGYEDSDAVQNVAHATFVFV